MWTEAWRWAGLEEGLLLELLTLRVRAAGAPTEGTDMRRTVFLLDSFFRVRTARSNEQSFEPGDPTLV